MPVVDDGFEALLEPFYNGKKLTDPISTKEDKFQLLPAFLKVKGEYFAPLLGSFDVVAQIANQCQSQVWLSSMSTENSYPIACDDVC